MLSKLPRTTSIQQSLGIITPPPRDSVGAFDAAGLRGLGFGTPRSNTGLFSQPGFEPQRTGHCISIDNLVFLWTKQDDDRILGLTSEMLNVIFDFSTSFPRKIGCLWDRNFYGLHGCIYSERDTATGIHCRLTISGTACQASTTSLLYRYCQMLRFADPYLRCSRFDIALDLFDKNFPLDSLDEALVDKNFSGFQQPNLITNFSRSGWTYYLGSRNSESYVCLYDKFFQSKGLINSQRWEQRYGGVKSDYVFQRFADLADFSHVTKFLYKFVVGSVDFIDKHCKNLDRCQRLDWFSEFLYYIHSTPLRISAYKIRTSVESKMHWIARQVETSLALISRSLSQLDFEQFIHDRIASGLSRMRPSDDILLLQYQLENQPFGS
jgi:Replication initiation factor